MKMVFTPNVSRNTKLTLNLTATIEEWLALVRTVNDAKYDARSISFSRMVKQAVEEIDKHFQTEQSLEE